MLADAVEQQGRGLIVEIGEVGAFELCVDGKIIREIEAEGELALEPGFDGVPVRRDDLRRLVGGERGDVLIAGFGDESSGFRGDDGGLVRLTLEDGNAGEGKQKDAGGGPPGKTERVDETTRWV